MERSGDALPSLLDHFREAFRADPVAAYRDWYRAQEELREDERIEEARALADDLWSQLDQLHFADDVAQAKFRHNVAVFFGSPGPAADLRRATSLFESVLGHFDAEDEAGWRARALHNFATALSNLGQTPEHIERSLALFDQALAWRTDQREIARGVSLHNLGLALRRAAELQPERAIERLRGSARALEEATNIRRRNGLVEGADRSAQALERTLERLKDRTG